LDHSICFRFRFHRIFYKTGTGNRAVHTRLYKLKPRPTPTNPNHADPNPNPNRNPDVQIYTI